MASLTRCYLLEIPREIRDMIYVEVFADDVYEIDREGAEPLGAGLLRACKQIYNEAYNAYYEHTIFYLRDTRNGIRWITSISRDRLDKIQDLRFDTAQTEERMLFENACHGNKEQYCLNRLVELLGVKGISLQAGVLKGSVENEDGVKFWSEQPCKDPRPLRRWLTMRKRPGWQAERLAKNPDWVEPKPRPWWKAYMD